MIKDSGIGLVMKILLKFACLSAVFTYLSCTAPPKTKIDRIYSGLQELLPRFDPSALSGRVVLIDPGHGGKFRGAAGVDSLEEAGVNLGVSLYLGGLLAESGAEVHFTRSADKDFLASDDSSLAYDLAYRASAADSIKPDIFISIHHNAHGDRREGGNAVETYYRFGDPASRDLAFAVHRHLMRNLGISRGQIRQGNYYVLRSVEVPAVLGEASYISDPHVEKKLKLSEKQRLEAEAYYLGILDYFRRGTPKLSPVFPGDTTVSEVPLVVFKAKDVGGMGIDPDAVVLNINGLDAAAVSDPDMTKISCTMPWNSPNGFYDVTAIARNVQGNSSSISRMRFKLDIPPERAFLEADPPLLPMEGGTLRIRVLLLDKRGLNVAEGSIVSIRANPGQTPRTAVIENGYLEFPLNMPGETDSAELTVSTKEREFSFNLSGSKNRKLFAKKKLCIIDADSSSPVTNARIEVEDVLIQNGSQSGVYFIPASGDSVSIHAAGYQPLNLIAGGDTLRLLPWFGGLLQGSKLLLAPYGGGGDPKRAGTLGLPASHVNLETARYAAGYLKAAGAEVKLTRNSEAAPTDQDIVAAANDFVADRYVEIRHYPETDIQVTNPDPQVNAYYFPGSERGEAAARTITKTFAYICGLQTFSADEKVTYPLQQTACPALIIEAPSITLLQEELKLNEPWYLRLQAYALFMGILKSFGGSLDYTVELNISVEKDGGCWLVTLDDTWNLLSSPDGRIRFYAVEPGRHHISAIRGGRRLTRSFNIDVDRPGPVVLQIP